MPRVSRLVLANFKKFESLTLDFETDMNVLIGDNEAGKSSVLLAMDLAMSASRNRVESLGVESLLSLAAVKKFQQGDRSPELLPCITVDVFLEDGENQELNGNQNAKHRLADGLRMIVEPLIQEYGEDINALLGQNQENFPYEYYAVKFYTFSGAPYASFKRYIRHLMLDNSRIDSSYAVREYIRTVFNLRVPVAERYKLENSYRQGKKKFREEHFTTINEAIGPYQFDLRTTSDSNLETDLDLTQGGISLLNRGKGQQCFIKTEFALGKQKSKGDLDVMLLEEPENHLSFNNMKKLVKELSGADNTQLFIATHSSHICSRLDLRHALMLGPDRSVLNLKGLSPETADFFMKAPDNNILEFALSKKVILVEGDAEFILLEALYSTLSGGISPENDGVHIISIGGTSFKRYLELAKLLGIRVAAIRDNDSDHEKNCVLNYQEYIGDDAKIFTDDDNSRSTFEICLYLDNQAICEELFAAGRKTLTVQEYMLSNKAEAAFELLNKKAAELTAPKYIREAVKWIRL
ncbi:MULTISPECIES: ATP-dependent nuclease [Yersinia]|uniref:ATP-dependent endonuclease n=1 Tax=Yersinia rochesterensis TaxID=1604335 RepID=A0A8D4SRZ8_9GAMM|nr:MULTISPECIES: TOPRIM nucleotidyl transferase/hydrolase domain-containing protein [Yersinia]AYD45705.1 ATP-dependent endonuclease [Yersinia rochesterensis]CFR29130.1 recombination protein F [Yersinia frederiksenii]CQJ04597.1 recombination protein F [Yersinia frederiksenii]